MSRPPTRPPIRDYPPCQYQGCGRPIADHVLANQADHLYTVRLPDGEVIAAVPPGVPIPPGAHERWQRCPLC